jgi:cardiolipin synthase
MAEDAWIPGNRFRLLENGEEFFPAVFAAIESAREEVLLETFILFEDKVGLALHKVLVAAAKRGVQVNVTVDGFGSPELSSEFIRTLADAGVHLHVFDPPPRLSRRLQPFRRLHCKIVVVDGERGFIGGLNFSADHLADYGPQAKQDYAVEAEGPIVASLRRHACGIMASAEQGSTPKKCRQAALASAEAVAPPLSVAGAQAQFVARDNQFHRTDIERHYRRALQRAQHDVIIANAYFFPGYRLMKSLQRAAKRGVKVQLILQGQPDIPWAAFAARMLYDRLLKAGVVIHEYCERPMHGKVAVVDDDWATVGSSNLDPLSLSLNLEANLVIQDRAFNATLRDKLVPLMEHRCRRIERAETSARRWWWRLGVGYLAFHVMRHFPQWASRLPAHRPQVLPAGETPVMVSMPREPDAQPWPWRAALEQAADGPRE